MEGTRDNSKPEGGKKYNHNPPGLMDAYDQKIEDYKKQVTSKKPLKEVAIEDIMAFAVVHAKETVKGIVATTYELTHNKEFYNIHWREFYQQRNLMQDQLASIKIVTDVLKAVKGTAKEIEESKKITAKSQEKEKVEEKAPSLEDFGLGDNAMGEFKPE